MADHVDDILRQATEEQIKDLAAALKRELAVNEAQMNPARRVHTSILVVREDERFIAMDGSAHRMGELFRELFERRPDLVGVVRETLDQMFRIANR